MVLVDLVIYTGVYDITQFNDFVAVIGFVLFASVSCNLLYNYISVRYGKVGIIAYRLITVLYVYLIPVIPNMYIYFRSFLRMIYPYIIYLILEHTYSKSDFVVSYSERNCEDPKNILQRSAWSEPGSFHDTQESHAATAELRYDSSNNTHP
jgi:hypothetical protein